MGDFSALLGEMGFVPKSFVGTGRLNRKEAGGGSDRLVNNKTELLGKKNTDPNRGFQGDVGKEVRL